MNKDMRGDEINLLAQQLQIFLCYDNEHGAMTE
jgi:hypothetical protein